MRSLVQELIPHAPKIGLFVAPEIPPDKLRNALRDYAPGVHLAEVLALFDGTLLGSAKDGAVFCKDRFVFQNTDLDEPMEIRYEDVVRVTTKKKLLRGRKVHVDVNRGRATTEVVIDFSGRPEAADHVAAYLSEAMLKDVEFGSRRPGRDHEDSPSHADDSFDLNPPPSRSRRRGSGTDRHAVEDALDQLHQSGRLSREDKYRMLEALDQDD